VIAGAAYRMLRRGKIGNTSPVVITGLVPVMTLPLAMPCIAKRDGRAKPGHDDDDRLIPLEPG
jgi:hypothetical protein